jgi:hypothetical protein
MKREMNQKRERNGTYERQIENVKRMRNEIPKRRRRTKSENGKILNK